MLGAGIGAGCGGDNGSDGEVGNCSPGALGCECSGGACAAGLLCVGGTCMNPGGDGDVGTDADTDSGVDTDTDNGTESDTDNGTESDTGSETDGGMECGVADDGTYLCPCFADQTCLGSLVCSSSNACICPGGLTACGTECVDTAVNPNHCGGCNESCDVGGGALQGSCEAGSCGTFYSKCGHTTLPQGQYGSCDWLCESDGYMCVENGCSGGTTTARRYGSLQNCHDAVQVSASEVDTCAVLDGNPVAYRCCCAKP